MMPIARTASLLICTVLIYGPRHSVCSDDGLIRWTNMHAHA
jgi:hypothetical protein